MRVHSLAVLLLTAMPTPPLHAQSLNGHVFVTLGDGRSELVRGEVVSLVCAGGNVQTISYTRLLALQSSGRAVLDGLNAASGGDPIVSLAKASGAAHFARTYLPRLIVSYYDQFLPVVIKSTRTDYQGLYSFDDVQPGRYFVVAAFSNSYNDALWRTPITIATGAPETLDLANHNLIDLRKAVQLDEIERKIEWIDMMVERYVSDRSARLAFADGRLAAVRSGASQPLPAQATTPALTCQ